MAGDDCAEALEQMYEFLDSELDSASKRKIQDHLDECGPCLQHFDLERVVKHKLESAVGHHLAGRHPSSGSTFTACRAHPL